nr:hypothetical protein [Tanacetum cinerariifolium]
MMTCHLSIRPAATCTVPRTQLLAVSRHHVAASYWTAASDVAPTSAPVSAGQRRSTSPATGQRRLFTVVIGYQRRRSTTVNAAGHRSTTADHGGDRRSTMAVNDGRRWRTTVDYRWTTGPPVNGGWLAGQRLELGRYGSGLGRVLVGSGSGLGRVWAGLPRGMPRVSHVCTRVSHVCPRGIHVDADVDIKH